MKIIVVNVNTSESMTEVIAAELGVPVVDGIGAAVRLAEALVGLGLVTSKVSTYAPPDRKQITGWPLSLALGLRSGAGGAHDA
jgi:allantoin racemase